MRNIFLIVQREYLSRVRKKSFIIMSILGPLMLVAFYGIIIWANVSDTDTKQTIKVIDESGTFASVLKSTETVTFLHDTHAELDEEKRIFGEGGYDALLYIPDLDINRPIGVTLFAEESIGSMLLNSIQSKLKAEVKQRRVEQMGITREQMRKLNFKFSVNTVQLNKGEESDNSVGASSVIGFLGGFLIYMFIFIYSAQVMKGVMEEKANRIVEVIMSSVKPFELMMGKIIGVAGVSLTQLLIWCVLGTVVMFVASFFVIIDGDILLSSNQMAAASSAPPMKTSDIQQMINDFSTVNYPMVIGVFFFYFIFAYLMYAALFAAIGAAVDNQTDSQQFMLPISMPLIISITLGGKIVTDPTGDIAFWMSMFPLTSPVATMIRLPFIGFGWEVMLSMTLLLVSFIFVVWFAAKIYRVGILLHGKKPSYKDLYKWLKN